MPFLKEINLAVLIIGYKRPANIALILDLCQFSGISEIFVSIDGPKEGDLKGLQDFKKIKEVVLDFRQNFLGEIKVNFRKNNVGCAASVLSSCDWFFEQTEYGMILEDDCIPSKYFFDFARSTRTYLEETNDVWLSCGTQFAPNEILPDSPILSKYALTWGWVTTRQKWLEIRENLMTAQINSLLISHNSNIIDSIYWQAGSRRAYKGFTDVWDTILVYLMQVNNKYAILPSQNLVSNIGDDIAATHTKETSIFLNKSVGKFIEDSQTPQFSNIADAWIKKNVYSISFRHAITTNLTRIKDYLNKNKRKPELLNRWINAKI